MRQPDRLFAPSRVPDLAQEPCHNLRGRVPGLRRRRKYLREQCRLRLDLDLAQSIIELINPNAKIISDEERLRPDKSEVERLFGDNTKIQSLTNWKCNYSLKEGLKETIEWFNDKENLKKYKADIYNV